MASERTKDVLSVVALAAGFLLSLGLMVAAVAVSLCGLFGEQCSGSEEQAMTLLSLGAIGTFFGVPVVVAAVREQVKWLLAPIVEGMLLVTLFAMAAAF